MSDEVYPSQGFFDRMLKRPFLKGLAYELKELLPDISAAATINQSKIQELCDKYKIHTISASDANPAFLIFKMLASGATTDDLLADRTRKLTALAVQFGIAESEIEQSLAEARKRHFADSFREAVGSVPIQGAIRDRLFADGERLGLQMEELLAVARCIVQPILQQRGSEILADGMMSPDEEASLEKLASDLGGKFELADPESERVFRLARLRWRISQGDLPIVDCPLMLKRGETCHAVVAAKAYEERTRTVRVGYSGVSTRIKIVKGVYLNSGSYRPSRTTESYSFDLGHGDLVVSNKRLIFSSSQKALNWALDSIIDWTLYSDGIEIRRAAGKPVTFAFGEGNGIFLEVLAAARGNLIG